MAQSLTEAPLVTIPREPFTHEYFDYKPGEHVVFGGKTQNGKTSLAFDLLEVCATPELPAYVAQSKPRDKVTEQRSKALGFREVDDWPVPARIQESWNGKPRGYLVKVKFGSLATDMERSSRVTAKLLQDRYTAGVKGKKAILVMDDTMVKAKVQGLDGEMTTILAMAGAMGIGEWVFVQKPADSGRTTLWAFENGEHFFLFGGSDDRGIQRYGELAGANKPYVIAALRQGLPPFHCLYLKKSEGYICIVGAR